MPSCEVRNGMGYMYSVESSTIFICAPQTKNANFTAVNTCVPVEVLYGSLYSCTIAIFGKYFLDVFP